jgi:transcription antitermination factor NusG
MEVSNQWYVLFTKKGCEKKVSDALTKRKIESYCPFNRVIHTRWGDQRKSIGAPLFACYVFVRISDYHKISIDRTSGLINFVYWLKKPVVVPDQEIDFIKRYLNEFENVKLERVQVRENDVVRVIEDIPRELLGASVRQNDSLKILLPTLGFVMSAEVRVAQIKIMIKKAIPSSSIHQIDYALR